MIDETNKLKLAEEITQVCLRLREKYEVESIAMFVTFDEGNFGTGAMKHTSGNFYATKAVLQDWINAEDHKTRLSVEKDQR